jgi:hypothetical protein
VTGAPASPAALQADALVQAIEQQVAAQCRGVRDGAAREAAVIRQRARDKARRQLRRALAEMRAAEREQMQRTRAELESAMRAQASARAAALLAHAWPHLVDALQQRWRDPVARTEWVGALLTEARARLPAAGWHVSHPAGWSEEDCVMLRASLSVAECSDAMLQADDHLTAGLVIELGGARLDGTPAALLADRPRAEATLLAALVPAQASR